MKNVKFFVRLGILGLAAFLFFGWLGCGGENDKGGTFDASGTFDAKDKENGLEELEEKCSADCECTPDCAGLECGLDPKCGVSCGECGTGFGCDNGQCVSLELCGNNLCDSEESYCNCSQDCAVKCGDGCCSEGENFTNCSQDCKCVLDCTGKECGDDGCGKQCGSCGSGKSCQDFKCVGTCLPDCTGKECGSDGCGGSCGTCTGGKTCVKGQCVSKGIWTDPSTGLTWQNPPVKANMIWYDAKGLCNNLTQGGYGDWRLPTISELRSLIRGCPGTKSGGSCGVTDSCLYGSLLCYDDACKGCTGGEGPADGCYWPKEMDGICSWYWSLSSNEVYDDALWYVEFSNGGVYSYGKFYSGYVRCVR